MNWVRCSLEENLGVWTEIHDVDNIDVGFLEMFFIQPIETWYLAFRAGRDYLLHSGR